ncbi:GNAT family N-acetyltransferase [Endozoicomonas ascidiicola]|uniref:GNAT family N-acetyltransferase n=1 Tax=Endozoicomonas ascidiicola TaxID=1698521 RepID=UPI0012FDF05C|nr:GNAT family N-acetyltransferase [Endozoicomonas ascidiicola]
MSYFIRPSRPEDTGLLWGIYQSSIQTLGKPYYRNDQLQAWSGSFSTLSDFGDWLEKSSIFVVENAGIPVGFAGFEGANEENGRIASLFVHPEHGRKGIASMLLEHLMNQLKDTGKTLLTTAASELSKPLFEKFGFTVREIETTILSGIEISRYAMECRLIR